jgi:2-keto-4-pentenoate hydratase/2-oxohepta-3-ene-1,7-dioic acid hydratase in catechol pathway
LPAGTVILTGTPHGVGMARKPPRWLRPGDVVSIEIEGIGTLANPVANEQLFGGESPHSKQHDHSTG